MDGTTSKFSPEQDSNQNLSLCHSTVKGICGFGMQHLYITTANKLSGEFFKQKTLNGKGQNVRSHSFCVTCLMRELQPLVQ